MKSNFESLKSMSVDEFAEWLDKNGSFDDSPWLNSFNEKYCEKCESVTVKITEEEKLKNHISCLRDEFECTYCEVYNKCRYFENMDDVPDNREMIKLWLEANCEETAKTVEDELHELFALGDARVNEMIEWENKYGNR
jgi:hypothetical protein